MVYRHFTIKNKRGTSILEIVVVIMIISIGMVAVLSLVQQNVRTQGLNSKMITASMLAQEGVEIVRNIRDRNWQTSGANFYDGIAASTGSEAAFIGPIQPETSGSSLTAIFPPSFDNSASQLYTCTGTNDGYIGYTGISGSCDSGGIAIPFKRIIKTRYDLVNNVVYVTCEVSWDDHGVERIYGVSSEIYNWY